MCIVHCNQNQQQYSTAHSINWKKKRRTERRLHFTWCFVVVVGFWQIGGVLFVSLFRSFNQWRLDISILITIVYYTCKRTECAAYESVLKEGKERLDFIPLSVASCNRIALCTKWWKDQNKSSVSTACECVRDKCKLRHFDNMFTLMCSASIKRHFFSFENTY